MSNDVRLYTNDVRQVKDASSSPRSRRAVGLTREAIAAGALRLVHDHGLESLTMRALADELGVRAPSLYHHVRDREALLTLMAQHAVTVAFSPEPYDQVVTIDDWIAVTKTGALRARSAYLRHPGLARVMLEQATPMRDQGNDPRAALVRAEIDALVRVGVPPATARRIFEAGAHWTLAAIAAESRPGSTSRRDTQLFRDGLDLLLDGVRARVSNMPTSPVMTRPSGRSKRSGLANG